MFNYFFKDYIEFNILSLNQAFINKKQQKPYFLMMLRKSTVSYTANTQSQRHLHNTKKREPNREHRCGASRIPSEG